MTPDPRPTGFLAADWHRPGLAPRPVAPATRRARVGDEPGREQARVAALVDRAKLLVAEQFDRLRGGGTIDLPAVQRTVREVTRSIERNRYLVIGLTRLRSSHEYTWVHSLAVSALMIGLARELGQSPAMVELAGVAGMLHDVGKARIPTAVLDKPGPLSAAEWVTIKTHPERGHAILSRLGGVDPVVLDVALHHHERLDGSGYPHGLEGDAISLHARIAAVCDVYDALTSRRAYKEGRPAAVALDWMTRANEGGGEQFDPRAMRALRTLIGAFPAGTLVRLQHGQLGTVLSEPPLDPLSPRVAICCCADTRRPLPPAVVETGNNPIVAVERFEDWPELDG